MDGITLDKFEPGTVRDVSAAIGAWLIVEGYAEPEMRRTPDDDLFEYGDLPVELDRRHR